MTAPESVEGIKYKINRLIRVCRSHNYDEQDEFVAAEDLRAAVERVIRERDDAVSLANKEGSEGFAPQDYKDMSDGLRACRLANDNLRQRAERAEADRDAAIAMLREARGIVHAYLRSWPQSDAGDLLARIDALLTAR